MRNTQILIIGAGPFGLSLAACARKQGMECLVVGQPFRFWMKNMPDGMFLRSGIDWHLDPNDEFTLERFVDEARITEHSPLPIGVYLQYLEWFVARTQPEIHPTHVKSLRRETPGFVAQLDDGNSVRAQQVVVATGFEHFACFPDELVRMLPPGRFSHTCHSVDPAQFAGLRVLVVGGRQSAFEMAALMQESGARQIDLTYRHDTPRFTAADWSWVKNLIGLVEQNPAWFSHLDAAEKEAYRYRFWAEGRLKIEPWLEDRTSKPNVQLHPNTALASCEILPDDSLQLTLNNRQTLVADHVLLATGYKAQLSNLAFLDAQLLRQIDTRNGYPALDPNFQSSVPGLYFSSFLATQDFGPFMAFTVSATMAARVIGRALVRSI